MTSEPKDVRQRVDLDDQGLVVRVEREILPPRLRDVPPPPPVWRAPVAAARMDAAPGGAPLPMQTWEWVTPAVATDWLGHNTGNRPIKASRVAFYARQMREGLWRHDNPDGAICFDRNHRLRNGQHRLRAVEESGQTIGFLVTRGIDPALGDIIDTPAVRTAGDRLALAGGVKPAQGARYAAAIRGLEAWEEHDSRGPFERQPTARSNAEMVALLPKYVELLDYYLPLASTISKHGVRGGDSLWLTLLCRFHRIDPEAAQFFGEHLASGEDLSRGNPILVLRNTLLNADPVTRPGSGIGRLVTARFAALAWNAWREGRSLSELHQGAPGEKFPKIEGQDGYEGDAGIRRRAARRLGQFVEQWPGAHPETAPVTREDRPVFTGETDPLADGGWAG